MSNQLLLVGASQGKKHRNTLMNTDLHIFLNMKTRKQSYDSAIKQRKQLKQKELTVPYHKCILN